MKGTMARFRLFILLPLLALFAAAPGVTFAAGFFGPILPQSGSCNCGALPLDWGCVLQVLQNLIQFAVSLGVILCVLWIAYAGFSLMASGGSPEARSQGKARIMNAIVGILVILSAWLVVDFVMKTLYNPQTTLDGGVFGPWNSILADNGGNYCIQPHTPVAITAGSLLSNLQTVAPGTSSGGGVCAVQSSGPCAASNLGAFGAAASQASQICSAESANGTQLKGDYTTQGFPVSFGLFQINITAHSVGGLNCPSAFDSVYTGSHHNVNILNGQVYNACTSVALNPSDNIETALSIYTKDGDSWREWSSHTKCGLSYLEQLKFAVANEINKIFGYE